MLERELTKLAGENWQVCIFKLNQYLSSLISFFYRTLSTFLLPRQTQVEVASFVPEMPLHFSSLKQKVRV